MTTMVDSLLKHFSLIRPLWPARISIVLLTVHLHQYSFCSLQYINDNLDVNFFITLIWKNKIVFLHFTSSIDRIVNQLSFWFFLVRLFLLIGDRGIIITNFSSDLLFLSFL